MYRFLPLVLVLGCPRSQEEASGAPEPVAPDAPAPEADAESFTTATSGELGLIVMAGFGGEVFLASAAHTAAHADAASDGCPQATLTADGYELSANDCEAPTSGRVWSGRLVMHNPTELPELPGLEGADFVYDASLPAVAEYSALSAALGGDMLAWEGSLEITPKGRGTLVDVAMTTTAGANRPLTALTTFGCGLPGDPSWCGPIGEDNVLFLGDDLEIAPSMDPEDYANLRFEANGEVLSVDMTTLDYDSYCVVGTLQSGDRLDACLPDEEIVDVEPVVSKKTDEAP